MKHLLAGVAVVALLAGMPANADTIITFGQNSSANTITGTGGLTGTTITGSDIAVTITQIASADPTPISAFLDLSAANSTGATVTGGVVVTQHFSGTFSICSTAACAPADTNYLSGAFTDGAIAVIGGTQIVIAASTAVFASDTIATLDLPRAIGFSLTNVDPPVSVTACPACDTGETIASFTASIAGNAAANAVPEPASLLLLGGSLFGLAGAFGWRRRFGAP
jgi:hypothetical protein